MAVITRAAAKLSACGVLKSLRVDGRDARKYAECSKVNRVHNIPHPSIDSYQKQCDDSAVTKSR